MIGPDIGYAFPYYEIPAGQATASVDTPPWVALHHVPEDSNCHVTLV